MYARRCTIRFLAICGDTGMTITQDMRRSVNVVTGKSSAIWVGTDRGHHHALARSFGANVILRVTLKSNPK